MNARPRLGLRDIQPEICEEIFITLFVPKSMHMYDITRTRKMENGVAVYFKEGGNEKFESFNYSELIDLKINALDLLQDPKNYAVDPKAHRLMMKK